MRLNNHDIKSPAYTNMDEMDSSWYAHQHMHPVSGPRTKSRHIRNYFKKMPRSSSSRSHGSSSQSNAADRKAIVIIPAAYSVPNQYEKVASYCRSFGSEVIVVCNPSTEAGSPGRAPSLYDDAANARARIESLVRRGKEVMVVGHAYGAMVATQCCQGLSQGEVRRGGVVRLLFIAGIVAIEGQHAIAALGGMSGLGLPDAMAVSAIFPCLGVHCCSNDFTNRFPEWVRVVRPGDARSLLLLQRSS